MKPQAPDFHLPASGDAALHPAGTISAPGTPINGLPAIAAARASLSAPREGGIIPAAMETYRVKVSGDGLLFSAAHFITFSASECERIHGHNYTVGAELTGKLGPERYVYDFVLLRRLLREVLASLDHRVLLPLRSTHLRVEERGEAVRAAFGRKEWVFPRDDCALLPVENTTVEEMAAWIAARLREEMSRAGLEPPLALRVEVAETMGQAGVFETA